MLYFLGIFPDVFICWRVLFLVYVFGALEERELEDCICVGAFFWVRVKKDLNGLLGFFSDFKIKKKLSLHDVILYLSLLNTLVVDFDFRSEGR